MLIYLAGIGSEEEKSKFEYIYESYQKQIYYVALRILKDSHLAEDAVHETFLKLIPKLPDFKDPKSGETRRYVILTAESVCIDMYRKKHKRDVGAVFFEDLPYEVAAAASSDTDEVAILIEKLPLNYSVIIKYKYTFGFTDKEIAKELAITESNVRKRLERARNALLKLMEGAEATL